MRSARHLVLLGALLTATARCSFFAPPDSETVGTRPKQPDHPDGAAGGAAGADSLGDAGAGEAGPGPVDVGTPTGAWAIPTGTLLTSWGSSVDPSSVHREYPRPMLVRSAWATLNGLWDYALRSNVDAQPTSWDGKILVPFALEAPLSGVGRPLSAQGQLWYRRTFQMPAAWRDRQLLLHFGAADFDAHVFVNGVAVGEHQGGYDAFDFDVTDSLVSGATQEVVVAVSDPTDTGGQPRGKQSLAPKSGSLTAVSGIWQSVWIEPVSAGYVSNVELVPSAATGKVSVKADLGGTVKDGATISVTISDAGTPVANADGAASSTLTLTIPDPKLWSPASPTLYDVSVTLKDDSGVIDSVKSYVGLRDVAVHADDAGVSRIFLNEKPLFQLGVVDQGNWPDGLYTAPSDEAMQTDIARVKQLGFVALRKHQKVEPDRFYYWCDKLGLLVWQDMPIANDTADADRTEFETELSALVTQHQNHPSIVAWDLFYFGAGQFDPARLTESVKALDPTRLVDAVTGYPDDGSGEVRDRPDFARASSPTPSSRASMLGELGSLKQGVDGHVWHSSTKYNYNAATAVPAATDRYQTLIDSAFGLNEAPGLSGAMFRQLTDVEGELDGMFTYDRALLKLDSARLSKLNAGSGDPIYTVLETSDMAPDPAFTPSGTSSYASERHRYRYTLVDPGPGWEQPGFDDSSWSEGAAPFGNGLAGYTPSTTWVSGNIWIRGTFDYEGPLTDSAYVRIFHDDDVWVYVNGALAINVIGPNLGYDDVLVSDAAQRSLKAGRGTIAARCINRGGGQFLDVGLVLRPEGPTLLAPLTPAVTSPGAIYAKYTGTAVPVPTFSSLTPVSIGTTTTLTLDVAAPTTQYYALEFEGLVTVPRDGLYTFFIASDDNSVLSVDGQKLASVSVSALEYSGNIGLKAGKHSFVVGYTQATPPSNLSVSWAGPGVTKQALGGSAISHEVQPAATVASPQPGLAFSQYNGTFGVLPDFTTLTPNATGTATTINPLVANIPAYYGLEFTGYINVATAGVYTMLLTADDGAKLWIGDVVVDNDGTHSAATVTGQVALAAGKQPFTLGYFQRSTDVALDLSWIGPGITQTTVPASVLFH